MMQQAVGDWSHSRLPACPEVWVPGCGRFEALAVALRCPRARVVGSDLAEESLAACHDLARELEVPNLELRQESLTEASYRDRFDLVISTGVIHHLSEPDRGLAILAASLRRHGLLELMVYNRFHRTGSDAIRQALALLSPGAGYDRAVELGRRVLAECPLRDRLGELVESRSTDELFADTFLQPMEHSFTVQELATLGSSVGLQVLQPRLAAWDTSASTHGWEMEFRDEELARNYRALDDLQRWQVTNLLRRESSPLLWFYLQRADGPDRVSERALSAAFLDLPFVRAETHQRRYLLSPDGCYRLSHEAPPARRPPGELHRRIVRAVDGKTPIRRILQRFEVPAEPGDPAVTRLRLELTTPTFPHLTARRLPDERAADLAAARRDRLLQRLEKARSRGAEEAGLDGPSC